MAIETCKNCKRIIGELEQAYTWQSHILCKECYARLSNPTVAQPTPVDVHAPVILPHPQRSLVKSTLIVMATVIPVLVVIYIVLSILSSYETQKYEAKKLTTEYEQERISTTAANLKILHNAVNQFKMDTGRFPTEEEGLKALVEQPSDVTRYEPCGYFETTEIPKDGWGNDFVYRRSNDIGKPFVIFSSSAVMLRRKR
ncbi:MAG: type II secretion system protein GspG [Sedimentisphaerales bacterium]